MEHNDHINGVHIKQLVRHEDARGYFVELMKKGGAAFHEVAQTSYAIAKVGVIKAFHYHDYWETWVALEGEALAVMHDIRPDSRTYGTTQTLRMGGTHPVLLSIPPGVAHGYKALGEKAVGMLYHAGEAYDASRPDQIKTIPHDSSDIGFNWDAV